MNRSNFQQMEIRHVKLIFQQREMQEMQLLEPIQYNFQSLQSCATALYGTDNARGLPTIALTLPQETQFTDLQNLPQNTQITQIKSLQLCLHL